MKNIIYSFLLAFALFLTGCADAGEDQTVNKGETVTLDADESTTDHGGEIEEYLWKQVKHRDTPEVQLSDENSVSPTFVAPDVNVSTTLTFRLKTIEVKRSRRYPSYDYVCITVLPDSDETDTTPPVITLIGETHITLNVGDTYTELGATATDNVDGNITSNIIIDSSDIDVEHEGNYTVTYNVSDDTGNEADEVTRTVNVY